MENLAYRKKTARTAGLLYLLMGFTGMFGMLYVPSQIMVAGDVVATGSTILERELLFRLGILSQLACQIVFVYLALTLDRLLRSIDPNYAKQMVALVLVSVPIAFLNLLNQLAALILLGDGSLQSAIDARQTTALLAIFLKLYEMGVVLVQIFWGLWLIPFGMLVYKSVFIPRIFGILLVVGGAGYVVASCTSLLFPQQGAVVAPIASAPSGIAEFAIIFWLLIKGVRNPNPVSIVPA